MYAVEVKTTVGTWTQHSAHESYRDAVDQADMTGGRVITPGGASDKEAWQWATANQGFVGDFAAWQAQDDDERSEYELGAAGIPTQ